MDITPMEVSNWQRLYIFSTDTKGPVLALAKSEDEAMKKIRQTRSGQDQNLIKQYEINSNEVIFTKHTFDDATEDIAIPSLIDNDKTIRITRTDLTWPQAESNNA